MAVWQAMLFACGAWSILHTGFRVGENDLDSFVALRGSKRLLCYGNRFELAIFILYPGIHLTENFDIMILDPGFELSL